MSVDGAAAYRNLLHTNQGGRNGACWYFVWQADDAAGADTTLGPYTYAYDAAYASSGKHYDLNPPEGADIWLGERYDGNKDGDVFIAGTSTTSHAATDQPLYGSVGECSIQQRMNLTGREYLFWTDHVLDCPINSPGTTKEDDVKTTYKTFKQSPAQTIKGDGDWHPLRINDDGDMSVFTGEHTAVWGDLYLSCEPKSGTKLPPENAPILQVQAYLDTIENGKETGSVGLGIVELPYTTGKSSGMIPLPPTDTGKNQRIRFRAIAYTDAVIVLGTTHFRGAYSD